MRILNIIAADSRPSECGHNASAPERFPNIMAQRANISALGAANAQDKFAVLFPENRKLMNENTARLTFHFPAPAGNII